MDYLDNIIGTRKKESDVATTDWLHQAILDYTTVTSAIRMTTDKSQENELETMFNSIQEEQTTNTNSRKK